MKVINNIDLKYSTWKPCNILHASLRLQIVTVYWKPVFRPSRVHWFEVLLNSEQIAFSIQVVSCWWHMNAYECMFLSYRVVLVQLVPSRVVFAQSPPHSVLQGILWQTLSWCGCLSLIAQTCRSLKRDWKPILHTAHLLGIAYLTGKKEEKGETSLRGFVRLQMITLIELLLGNNNVGLEW